MPGDPVLVPPDQRLGRVLTLDGRVGRVVGADCTEIGDLSRIAVILHGIERLLDETDTGIGFCAHGTVRLDPDRDLKLLPLHTLYEPLEGIGRHFEDIIVVAAGLTDKSDRDRAGQGVRCRDEPRQVHIDIVEAEDQQVLALHEPAVRKPAERVRPRRVLVDVPGVQHLLVFAPDQGDIVAFELGALLQALRHGLQIRVSESPVREVVYLVGELFRHADLIDVLLIEQEPVAVLQEKHAEEHIASVPVDRSLIRGSGKLADLPHERGLGKHLRSDDPLSLCALDKGLLRRQRKTLWDQDQRPGGISDGVQHTRDQCRCPRYSNYDWAVHIIASSDGLIVSFLFFLVQRYAHSRKEVAILSVFMYTRSQTLRRMEFHFHPP